MEMTLGEKAEEIGAKIFDYDKRCDELREDLYPHLKAIEQILNDCPDGAFGMSRQESYRLRKLLEITEFLRRKYGEGRSFETDIPQCGKALEGW